MGRSFDFSDKPYKRGAVRRDELDFGRSGLRGNCLDNVYNKFEIYAYVPGPCLLYTSEQLINGLRTGSIYALIALGYTMVYGIAKMINFAHGDIIMVGAYSLYVFYGILGLGAPVAIVLSIESSRGGFAGVIATADRGV